jgi:hypothetical protein
MAGSIAFRYMAFIAAFHVVIFYAGANGVIAFEEGDNPDKQVIEDFTDQNVTSGALNTQESGIIEENFGVFFVIQDFLSKIISLITAPYSAINAAELPGFLQALIKVVMGVAQIAAVYQIATLRA